MKSVRSWDCFDTLVARKFFYPHTVFQEVALKISDENFVQKRLIAEKNSNKTYEDIYKNLPGIDPKIEFETELDHCFGIAENINDVNDGDIIVSDMYLSSKQIYKILEKCGLKKEIKIYVTSDGKRKGYIWKNINQNITEHIGDNYNSDFQIPKKFGIHTKFYNESLFNHIENKIIKYNMNLACFTRCLRLNCPKKDFKSIWQKQLNELVFSIINKKYYSFEKNEIYEDFLAAFSSSIDYFKLNDFIKNISTH